MPSNLHTKWANFMAMFSKEKNEREKAVGIKMKMGIYISSPILKHMVKKNMTFCNSLQKKKNIFLNAKLKN